jgi:hypothetical protein
LFEGVAFRPLPIGIGIVNLAVVPLLAVLMRHNSIPLGLGLASH